MMNRTTTLLVAACLVFVSACGAGNVFSLEVGQCFDDPDASDEVSDVPIVDCDEEHDNEVYYLFDLPDGSYPGLSSVQSSADEGCLAQFQAYVGRDYASSALGFWALYPTEGSWGQDDREIVCVLADYQGGTLVGSMRNSGV